MLLIQKFLKFFYKIFNLFHDDSFLRNFFDKFFNWFSILFFDNYFDPLLLIKYKSNKNLILIKKVINKQA
jgi:hypothetical protein